MTSRGGGGGGTGSTQRRRAFGPEDRFDAPRSRTHTPAAKSVAGLRCSQTRLEGPTGLPRPASKAKAAALGWSRAAPAPVLQRHLAPSLPPSLPRGLVQICSCSCSLDIYSPAGRGTPQAESLPPPPPFQPGCPRHLPLGLLAPRGLATPGGQERNTSRPPMESSVRLQEANTGNARLWS